MCLAKGDNEIGRRLMIFTNQQIDSARNGHVVRVATDSGELVILSADLYDRIARVISDDPRETYQSILSAWDAAGSPEDATAYQDLA